MVYQTRAGVGSRAATTSGTAVGASLAGNGFGARAASRRDHEAGLRNAARRSRAHTRRGEAIREDADHNSDIIPVLANCFQEVIRVDYLFWRTGCPARCLSFSAFARPSMLSRNIS